MGSQNTDPAEREGESGVDFANSLTRVNKRPEEHSQKRLLWAQSEVVLLGMLFRPFQALPFGREAKSTPSWSLVSRGMHLPGFLPAGHSQDCDGWTSKFALSDPCKSVSSAVNSISPAHFFALVAVSLLQVIRGREYVYNQIST